MADELLVERSAAFPRYEVLALTGPLTASNVPVFGNAMRREQSAQMLIIDLTEVPYMDSFGLGVLVSAYVSRQKAGHGTVLSGITPRVQKLLDITRVRDIFLIFSTTEEAVAALRGAAEA
ncbi:MAG: STAS domain-containing protein [Acidobacteria bacterium]|nr:STAS domain-containing protein [Acidobacteriota bacterium]MBV9622579.1 STAS domain-containing protein [Acidobacteriota bacterium]